MQLLSNIGNKFKFIVFIHTLCQDGHTSWVKFELIHSVFRMSQIIVYDIINYIKFLITLHLNSL